MNLINYIKSKPIVAAIALIFLAIFIYIAITEFRKPPSTPPLGEVEIINSFETKLSSIAIAQGTVNISTGMIGIDNFKPEVPILTYTPVDLNDDMINSFNQKLSVTQKDKQTIPGAGEIVISSAESKSLYTYKGFNSLIYTDEQKFVANTDYTFAQDADVNEYQKKAEDFIKSLGVDLKGYEFATKQYLNYPSDEPQPLSNLSAAGLIEFTYSAKTDDVSIVEGDGILNPRSISVLIDKDFVVRKANISLVGTAGKATANLKAKTINEIRESIQKGEASLTYSSFGPDVKILYTNVESAKLMYYASGDRLIPVYIIDATLTSEKGETGKGQLILKAF